MAAAFTNQPRTTPIYNQQQATQLGQGNFSSMQQPQMQGFGGQPGVGGGGGFSPLGYGFANTTIYAVVESGQPKIIDPKTGEYYPPGYIPTIQDPNTWEQWQPGQSWAETMELANAQFREGMRQAQETLLRPGEEAAANTAQQFLKDLSGAANKWSGQAAQNIYGANNQTLKDIQARATTASRQAISQTPQVAQQAVRQAPQAAQQAARQVGQATNQVAGQAARFFGGGSTQPYTTTDRSALTSVAGDRPFTRSARAN